MESVYVVIFWVKQTPSILGSFADETRARACVHDERRRAEKIYNLPAFNEAPNGDVDSVYCIKNVDQDTFVILKVKHDNTQKTEQ